MKITKVEAFSLAFDTNLKTIGSVPIRLDTSPVAVIKVSTDEGIEGYSATVLLTSAKVLVKYVEEVLAPFVVGQDPFSIEEIDNKLKNMTYKYRRASSLLRAHGCINIALWDIVGKALGKPVAELMGCYTNKVKAYASTAEFKEAKALAEDAVMYREMGFMALKLRGGRPNPIDDIKVVEEVRKAVGDTMEIWVDANQAYDRRTAMWLAQEFARYKLRSLEEPLDHEDIEGYVELASRSPISIAGGENLLTLMQWRNMLQRNALDIMQPWPAQSGGISGLRKLCALAEAFDRDIEPHAGLMIGEAIQVMCTTPKCSYVMWSVGMKPVRDALLEDSPEPVNGYFILPDKPGIGVNIKAKLLKR